MNCQRNDIKELLPAYLEGTLAAAERGRVGEHLAACRDCADEHDLLRFMAAEPAADPGEAFFSSLPGRVRRDIDRGHAAPDPWYAGLLDGLRVPRWGWAAAMVLVVAIAAVLLRPDAPPRTAKLRPAPTQDIIAEAAGQNDIRQQDLDQLSAWAHRELQSIGTGVDETALAANGGLHLGMSFEEHLADLNDEELEQLIDTLDRGTEEG